MTTANLETVLEEVKVPTDEERQELRKRLETWPAPEPSTPAEGDAKRDVYDEIDRRLLAAGVIRRIPPPITDLTPYRDRVMLKIEGKPVSETIIEERR